MQSTRERTNFHSHDWVSMLKGYVLAQAQLKLNLLYICLQALYKSFIMTTK